MAKEEEDQHKKTKGMNAETSREIRKHSVWKRLWGLNIKAKLKHFIWKCLQNCILVMR